jgi:hypothetical protein
LHTAPTEQISDQGSEPVRIVPVLPLGLRLRSAFSRFMIGLYLPSILQGMAKTMQWIWRPKFTVQYPEERHIPRKGYRGRSTA